MAQNVQSSFSQAIALSLEFQSDGKNLFARVGVPQFVLIKQIFERHLLH